MTDRLTQPPPLHTLPGIWLHDHGDLRFGQWFMNLYMPIEKNDELYNTRDNDAAFRMIQKYYESYQWEI